MSALRLLQLNSIGEIRAVAAEWDDLWRRSEVTLPTARAESIADWIEHCAPDSTVRVLAVERAGRFVAALPLIAGRLKGLLTVGRLPLNVWSWAGDLLLDPAADSRPALDLLLGGIIKAKWPLMWCDAVSFEAPHWRKFIAAAQARGLPIETRESFRVSQVQIDHDWSGYQRRWSKNHRRQIKRIEDRAATAGGAALALHREIAPDQVEPLFRRGFTIEDSGWKGAAGSSVLKSHERFALHLRQARHFAEQGELQFTFLELDGRPIAFEYGWNCKGVYHSFKIGYDESFAGLSPGQLLRHRLLERFFADPKQRMLDSIGPLTTATAKWSTATYPVGRLVLSTGPLSGRVLLHAYRSWWPRIQQLRVRAGVGCVQRSADAPESAAETGASART